MRLWGFRDVISRAPEKEWRDLIALFTLLSVIVHAVLFSHIWSGRTLEPMLARTGLALFIWVSLIYMMEFFRRRSARKGAAVFISKKEAINIWIDWVRTKPWRAAGRMVLVTGIAIFFNFLPLISGDPFWNISVQLWKLGAGIVLIATVFYMALFLAFHHWDFHKIPNRYWLAVTIGITGLLVLTYVNGSPITPNVTAALREVLAGMLGGLIVLWAYSSRRAP
jgi:hypothetical protein